MFCFLDPCFINNVFLGADFSNIRCDHVLFKFFVSCFAEYTDDEAHIPKHSSVIVRRTPIGGVKPAGRTFIVYVYLKYKMIV